MKRRIYYIYALILLSFLSAHAVSAQDIAVSSFKLLENDLTANTYGTTERDQNGEVAALIKIVTTEQGFSFDGGMVGITKVKQEVGEIWVYVPHGIKRITIKHPQLGILRDYFFPVPIQKARTYEMILTTGKVISIVSHDVGKQYVVFNVTPANAIVELNDEELLIEEGSAKKLVPYGTYNYRISSPNHHTDAGVVTITAEGKVEKNITLRPNYGWIKVDGDSEANGAYVYIDNERVGKLPYTSKELKSGVHTVKVMKNMYKTYEQQVEVSDNETTELNIQLSPNFAKTTLTATENAEIYVDGEYKGTSMWTGPLERGSYTVEVRKRGHHNTSIIAHITSEEERSIQLPNPIPILGSIEITSSPSNATITIDGKEVGTTPLLLPNLLVGEHEITFSKKNYQPVTKLIEVKENETEELHVKLSGECSIRINTVPSGAEVTMGERYYGTTPLACSLYAGDYTFVISKEEYNTIEKTITVDGSKEIFDFILKRRYVYPKMFYVDAGFSATNTFNIVGAVGLFYNNINAQLSYAYGLSQSEPIYWNGNTGPHERYYKPLVATGKLGYGFICGNRVRVTPQVGCSLLTLYEGNLNQTGDIILEGANIISGVVSMRCDMMLGRHFGLNITPEYLLPLWSSPWATRLKGLSSTIDNWDNGFSLQVGASLYF